MSLCCLPTHPSLTHTYIQTPFFFFTAIVDELSRFSIATSPRQYRHFSPSVIRMGSSLASMDFHIRLNFRVCGHTSTDINAHMYIHPHMAHLLSPSSPLTHKHRHRKTDIHSLVASNLSLHGSVPVWGSVLTAKAYSFTNPLSLLPVSSALRLQHKAISEVGEAVTAEAVRLGAVLTPPVSALLRFHREGWLTGFLNTWPTVL